MFGILSNRTDLVNSLFLVPFWICSNLFFNFYKNKCHLLTKWYENSFVFLIFTLLLEFKFHLFFKSSLKVFFKKKPLKTEKRKRPLLEGLQRPFGGTPTPFGAPEGVAGKARSPFASYFLEKKRSNHFQALL